MERFYSAPYIEDDKLYDFAASTARLLPCVGEGGGRSAAAALRRDYAAIRRCHEAVARRYAALPSPPAACEWLLDNWYLVQREGRAAAAELGSAGRLRQTEGEALILELSRALLRAGHGSVTALRCQHFLAGFQSVTVLRRRELLLFPAALRAAVLHALAMVCDQLGYAADSAPHARAFEALFGTLRLFSVLDTDALLTAADVTDAILAGDPSGHYPRMDRGTRQQYRERLEKLARQSGAEEHVCARRLLRQAAEQGVHIGFLLFPEGRARGAGPYIAANVLLTLFVSLLLAFGAQSALAAPLLLLPVSELVKSLLDALLLRLIPPRRLPRMDPERGLGPEGRTICVLSALLTDAGSGEALAGRLEEFRLAHRQAGANLSFGLLADLPGADTPETEGDEALLRAARAAIERLNRRYGGGFYLFTRPRDFDGQAYSGHERKRGALLELAGLLCDEPSRLQVTGDRDALIGTRYILTLDSDTRPYPGALTELIGAMLHPLNAPRLDAGRGLVTGGYGLLHPRMATDLASATETDFALIFAGPGGSDPYGALCGELYMNAFGSGGFAGKGILDARALLCCSQHLPEGCILSHDALEGAFLRGGYLGDVEFSDRFPAAPLAYYKRLHRWVRGDWQNAPWIFRRGRALRAIDRWRLLDSLRRSLLAPLTLLAVLAGFFLPAAGLRVAAWAALLALLSRLFLSLAEGGRRERPRVPLRRYTRLLTGVGGAIVQTFMRLWLLPYEAWICLSAALTALWRMLISRKKLLEWQTAAQAEQGRGGLAASARAMWPAMLTGLVCLLVSPLIIGRSAGLLWLLSPAAAAALALPAQKEARLNSADRDYLRRRAAETWRYFAVFSRPEDHFLPPDNVQEQPPVGPARRSSPTNMGLAAASAVAAFDLELIDAAEALAYIRRLTDTLERLPRCRGHFYNWYDTGTLLPLHPAYVSAVDSGNLYAGLLVARCFAAGQEDGTLAARLSALLEAMDFSPLYDPARGLFYICYDPARGCGTGGWYDLLASEARLTSYLAVAKGDVPIRHWRRLSRAQLQKDGFRGLASWTGTMFEYLMPELFLPLYRGSLLYESSRFCLYAQMRRAPAGKPWGISESAFFSLDSRLNYRYKAHGCQALALKRGQENELVVAPYASFLALCVRPVEAVRNLRRLERFGALGRWGYIDALDFTPGRCRSERGEPVRCTMVHHAGMSLLAAANALCEGSIRRRFMAESAMAAHSLLLQERLPEDGAVLRRRRGTAETPPGREDTGRFSRRGGPDDKGCCLLSNGAYHLLVDEQGRCLSRLGDYLIFRAPPALCLGETRLSPAPALFWELSEDKAFYTLEAAGLSAGLSVSAAAGDCGELRVLQLRAPRAGRVSLRFSFEPVLAPERAWRSHPAFWRLGLWSEERNGALLLRRLARGEAAELWLCLAADRPLRFSADRGGGLGWLSQPLISAEAELDLEAGESLELRLSLCVAATAEEALDGAHRILAGGELDRGGMVGAAATLLGLSPAEIAAAMELLPRLTRPRLHEAVPRSALWPYGLSGDLPILCCEAEAVEAEKLLPRFLLLKSAGLEADLVYLTGEQGEYHRPQTRRLSHILERHGLEALIGSPGGVHFAPLEAAEALRRRAAVFIGRDAPSLPEPPVPRFGAPRQAGNVPPHLWAGRSFRFEAGGSLPGRPWQQLLTNGSLGCLLSDSGSGFLWLQNARELPLTAPPALPEDPDGGEALWVEQDGRCISLFAANDGRSCRVSYSPGLAVWDKELGGRRIKTTAFVARDCDARVLLIEGAEGLPLRWLLRLRLGEGDGSAVRCRAEAGLLRAESPESMLPGTVLLAGASEPVSLRCDYAPAAALLSLEAAHLSVLVCGCCGEETLRRLCHPDAALAALSAAASAWAALTDRLELRSGKAALDRYMNGWAVYQTLACRLLGRCSLYQSGGAFGFRDQLQDAVNLLLLSPDYAREQLLLCCRHQYVEGDVMHWWHPQPALDKGVRTRCSDDLLWLVWALCEYVEATGDEALCLREEPYISSPPLREDERDRYEAAAFSEARASVLDHARAALERCIARGFGPHGLPWFGSGDWNDGLDAAGGESVWLGWFLAHCALRFAGLLETLDKPGAERYRSMARSLGEAAEQSLLPGGWYARGYRADGTVLGGEDRIDSVAQSWAVLSGCAGPGQGGAVEAALERLVDAKHGLVRLLDPPYSPDEPSPGYLSSYGEGFRENGGQYTHGAVWLALACFRLGRADAGWEVLELLLPENHDLRRYGAEPYVLAADVYSAPGHEGEAGWSWYTGSAGWYFRAVTEGMLGLRLRRGRLLIEPRMPAALPACRLLWTDPGGRRHDIRIAGGEVTLDGAKPDEKGIPNPPAV